jgi:hypothetical protein
VEQPIGTLRKGKIYEIIDSRELTSPIIIYSDYLPLKNNVPVTSTTVGFQTMFCPAYPTVGDE